MRTSILAALAALCAFASDAWAQASVTSLVQEIVEVRQADGTIASRRQVADNVTPGDRVAYEYRVSNANASPVERVVVTAQVSPALAIELPSVAAAGFDVVYSVDGGRSFGALASLTLMQAGRRRPARAEDITNVRWTRRAPLPVGAEDSCGFLALVR